MNILRQAAAIAGLPGIIKRPGSKFVAALDGAPILDDGKPIFISRRDAMAYARACYRMQVRLIMKFWGF